MKTKESGDMKKMEVMRKVLSGRGGLGQIWVDWRSAGKPATRYIWSPNSANFYFNIW